MTDTAAGGGAASVSGFTTNNVEILEVQSQAVGGTTLGLENANGLKTVRSASSNTALTVQNVKNLVALDVTGSLDKQNITVKYQDAVVAGTSDTQTVTLNGNSLGTLTVDGVETLAVTTATAASTVDTLSGTKFAKVTVAGDKAFTIDTALAATVTSVDASAQTAGGITLKLTNAADVAVKGGAGNDNITFTGDLKSTDSFDGGAGTDTITANTSEYTAGTYAVASKITNVEVLGFADQLSGTFDASKFTGENNYRLNLGFANATTIDKADDNSTVNVRAASAGNTLTYNISNASDANTANTVNIQVGGTTGVNAGTIVANGVETVNLTANGTAATSNTLTLTDAAVTKLTIGGASGLALTLGGTALTTVDASAATGNLDLSAVTYKAATSASITGGKGADTLVGSGAADVINAGDGKDIVTGGAGADTLTGGAGADTFVYNAVGDSSGSTNDTVTDFVSGTDLFNFVGLANAAGRGTIVLKDGAAANFGSAQAAIAAGSGTTQVVFQADTNTLWVDLNDDGTLNNNDLAIKLTGVTKVVAADVTGTSGGSFGNAVTLSAAAANVNKTTQTNATAMTTDANDFVTSTYANLIGSTVDGAGGSDTITVSDAITATFTFAAAGAAGMTLSNTENIVLSGGSTAVATMPNTANLSVTTSAASQVTMGTAATQSFTGGSAADQVTVGAAGQTISTGAGGDTITATVTTAKGSTFTAGAGADTLNLTYGGADTAFTFAAAAVSGGAAGWSGVETLGVTLVAASQTLTITPDADMTVNFTGAFAESLTSTGKTVTVGQVATQNLTLDGSSNFIVAGGTTGSITSTSTGTLAVTSSANNQAITSASTTTVDAAALNATLTIGGAGAFTVNKAGTVATSVITETGTNTGAITVNAIDTAATTVTQVTGATGAFTLNAQGGAGTGVVTLTALASHASQTINMTSTSAVTVAAASTATTYTVNATDANAHTYINSSTTSSVDTYVGGTAVDTVTLGLGADKFTSGGGADVININGTTDIGVVSGINASSAVPAQNQVLNVSGADIITGFSTGASVVLSGATTTATSYALVRNGGTVGADTTNNAVLLTGSYNSSTGQFTVDTAGTSSLLVVDSNGTAAGGSYVGVVLVGYIDQGGADTWIAAGTTGATFLAV